MFLKAFVQFSFYFGGAAIRTDKGKDGVDTIIRLALEFLYFSLPFYDQSDGYTLDTAGTKDRKTSRSKYGAKRPK